jgi:hypothetical protein
MINRAKMRRQLRAQGGIMNIASGTIGGGGYTGIPMGSRTGFGIIDKVKDRIRKLIPNEIADVAVKAAPFVAPFNPGIAGLMRGIGRFDQRGSISDAFKQGLLTTAAGAGARALGGATNIMGGGIRGGFTPPLSPDRTTAVKDFFSPGKENDTNFIKKITGDTSIKDATGLFKETPILKDLPSIVQQQILVGGASGALTYIYQAFLAEEPPQEEGETYEEYMTRRRANVGRKMKGYFDNYFKFDKEYSSMTEEQKQALIDRVNVAKGGMPTGIMKTNKAGVMERDYRDKGGFVPVGIKEKADDVPAMLSKNEFVMTADAVRGAGNGSIEKGAQRMYDTMKNLEKRVV